MDRETNVKVYKFEAKKLRRDLKQKSENYLISGPKRKKFRHICKYNQASLGYRKMEKMNIKCQSLCECEITD